MAALFCAAVSRAQTPNAAIQVSPPQLSFNDANVAFSQTIQVASGSESIIVDVAIDGGSPNSPPPGWLDVGSRTVTTPGRLRAFVGRLPAIGRYSARLVFRVRAAGTALSTFAVPVTLEVKSTATEFTVAPQSLQFLGQTGSFLPGQYIFLRGATCSEVTVRTSEPWLGVVPDAIPNCNRLQVGLRGGITPSRAYRGVISLIKGSARIDVPVTAFLVPPGPVLGTSPNGLQFETREGNGNAITRNIIVHNQGVGGFEWTARVVEVTGPTSWLSLGAISGLADADTDGRVPVRVDPGGLSDGTYYALIEIAAAGARSSPDLVPVVLRVEDAAAPVVVAPSPSGLLFSVLEGSVPSEPQIVTVFTSSTRPVSFRAVGVDEEQSLDWLSVSPPTGNTSTGSPGRTGVFVRPGLLKAGVYRGVVNTLASSGTADVRSVNVTMVIRPKPVVVPPPTQQPPPTVPPKGQSAPANRLAEGCTPTKLAATHTGLVSSFSTRVGWPTPLNVRVVDDCGDTIKGAQAVLTFSNGDPPLVLTNLLDGNYGGTWVPRNPASDSITIKADIAQAALSTSIELAGRVVPATTPIVAPNGVLNVFDRQPYGPLAPGTIIEIYGASLAGAALEAKLENDRLPETVNDVAVIFGSKRLPLYYVSAGQINAQIPMDAGADQLLPLVVRSGTSLSVPVRVPIISQQPGLLAYDDSRLKGHDENFALLSATNPARRGRPIVLYLVGMGITSPAVVSGAVSPGSPLAALPSQPKVTFAGKAAQILFAGLTPGFVGLYQVNVVVPADVTPGELEVVLTQGDSTSSTAKIQLQ